MDIRGCKGKAVWFSKQVRFSALCCWCPKENSPSEELGSAPLLTSEERLLMRPGSQHPSRPARPQAVAQPLASQEQSEPSASPGAKLGDPAAAFGEGTRGWVTWPGWQRSPAALAKLCPRRARPPAALLRLGDKEVVPGPLSTQQLTGRDGTEQIFQLQIQEVPICFAVPRLCSGGGSRAATLKGLFSWHFCYKPNFLGVIIRPFLINEGIKVGTRALKRCLLLA